MKDKRSTGADKGKLPTLSDADISSRRSTGRRPSVNSLGIGAGTAASTVRGRPSAHDRDGAAPSGNDTDGAHPAGNDHDGASPRGKKAKSGSDRD